MYSKSTRMSDCWRQDSARATDDFIQVEVSKRRDSDDTLVAEFLPSLSCELSGATAKATTRKWQLEWPFHPFGTNFKLGSCAIGVE